MGFKPTVFEPNTDESKIFREEDGKTVLVPKFYEPRAKKNVRTDLTMAEVRKHCTKDDLWIIIEGRVYDITKFVDRHPGGYKPILNLAGRDVTDAFYNYHPEKVFKRYLPAYYIGKVNDYHVSKFVQEHRQLRQILLQRGLFETDMSYYYKLGLWYLFLFVVSLYLTLACKSFAAHIGGALFMAAFWQQFAFSGHDIGHNSISHKRNKDYYYAAVFGPALMGISIGWWKHSHNVHHVVCNSIENDPDIQHMPVFAVTPKIFGKFWSSYHDKWIVTDWFARFIVQYQHIMYYPVMALARFNLYVQSYVLLLFKPHDPSLDYRYHEIASMLVFAIWYSALLSTLPTWTEVITYTLISHGVSGILHVQICISHFAMDTYHGNAYNDESDEWFKMQLKTTMNVDCPRWMDWFHGGLQFQIEHHLYPRLPRHNLRECSELVKALCKKYNLHYHAPGFFQANVELLQCLKQTANEAQNLKKGDGGFYESAIWESLNARG